MKVAIICQDKPGQLQLRLATREAHLAYGASTKCVVVAGPLLDEQGRMNGSLIILEVGSLEAAQSWAVEDPYSKAGLFESVQIQEWKQVV